MVHSRFLPQRGIGLWSSLVLLATVVTVVGPASPSLAAYTRPGATQMVSVASDGTVGNHNATRAVVSGDGRYVVFASWASNLVPGDSNGTRSDIFVRDVVTGTTELISLSGTGEQGNGHSGEPAITPDGRYVAFSSLSSNLVPGDTNNNYDIFVRDRIQGTTELVSLPSPGTGTVVPASLPSMSDDGRYVVFASGGAIFVRDRTGGVTEWVSPSDEGTTANDAWWPDISADGRYVVFRSGVSMMSSDTNEAWDIFVRDRQTGVLEPISVSSEEVLGEKASDRPTISADGRYVAFSSLARLLVPEDNNGTPATYGPETGRDVFVRDRTAGTTQRVSMGLGGAEANGPSDHPIISGDGRYVAFTTWATNVVPGDDTNASRDIFVHDLKSGATELVSLGEEEPAGLHEVGKGGSTEPAISGDGGHVTFVSGAKDLVPGDVDVNTNDDIYIRDRGGSPGVLGQITTRPGYGALEVKGNATFSGLSIVPSAKDKDDDGLHGANELAAEIISAEVAYRPEGEDLFVRTGIKSFPRRDAPSLPSKVCYRPTPNSKEQCQPIPAIPAAVTVPSGVAAPPGVVYGVDFEAGGVLWEARAALAYVALYKCPVAPACVEQARLDGSIGRTGNEVWISIPLGALGIKEGDEIKALRVFTGLGEAATGAPKEHDELVLGDTRVPIAKVEAAVVPPTTAEEEVTYGPPVADDLLEGAFSVTLPTAGLAEGDYTVWSRACVGSVCGAPTTSPVTLGPQPAPTLTPISSASPTPSQNSSSVSPTPLLSPSASQSPSATPSQSPTASTSPSATPSQTASASASPSATPSQSHSAPASPPPVGPSSAMTMTLATSKDKVRYGKKVALAGQVDKGSCEPEEVVLRIRDAGMLEFEDLRALPLEPDGSFSSAFKPAHNAFYVATVDAPGCDRASSSPVPVAVKAKVTTKAPRRCRPGAKIKGAVKPNHGKTVVLLQRKTRKGWKDLAGDRLSARSRYVMRAPSCKGRFRVVWKKQNVLNETGKRRLRL